MTNIENLQELAAVRRALQDGTARRWREDAGLSLTEVGTAAGVSPATLSRWEAGVRVPRTRAALRYAAVIKTVRQASDETA